jgi:signal peptidase I
MDMVKVSTVNVPLEWQALWDKIVRALDRRTNSSLAFNGRIIPEKKKKDVPARSLLPQISVLWNNLTELQRQAWKDAGAVSGYNGWNLFVQDTAYRTMYGYEGLATPSELHQYKVGKILVGAPGDKIIITQEHPYKYYKMHKIRGSKSLYSPVPIYEKLALPLEIGISYKSDLINTSPNYKARFYANVVSHYQGRNIETPLEINFDLQSDWGTATATIAEVVGVAYYYDLHIELDYIRGELLFDNVQANHSGSNFARDGRCNDINNELTKINYMIQKSWGAEYAPVGADYASVYVDN